MNDQPKPGSKLELALWLTRTCQEEGILERRVSQSSSDRCVYAMGMQARHPRAYWKHWVWFAYEGIEEEEIKKDTLNQFSEAELLEIAKQITRNHSTKRIVEAVRRLLAEYPQASTLPIRYTAYAL